MVAQIIMIYVNVKNRVRISNAHGFCRGDIKNCLFVSRLNVYIAKEVRKLVVVRSFVQNRILIKTIMNV